MTWAEVVKETVDALYSEDAIDDLDNIEKVMLKECIDQLRTTYDTISLARIATALEKMAGLPYDQEKLEETE